MNDPGHAHLQARPLITTAPHGKETVVVIDEFGGDYFDQLSCTLRRRDVQVVRISGVSSPAQKRSKRLARWARACFMYDAQVPASKLGVDGSLPTRFAQWRILDVLAEENTLIAASREYPAISALAAQGLAYGRFSPERLIEKFEVNAILESAGVRIPPQARCSDMSSREAVAHFGLPLVVKSATGAGGVGVRIAASLEEVERAVEDLSRDRGGAFYQKHIDGQTVMYAAVTGPTGPLLEHGFGVMDTRWRLGPSAVVRVFDDPRLLDAGRRAIRALGCLGLAATGFIRDRDGGLWHIDANIRCWGNMISLLCADIDYAGAYLALLRGRAYTAAPRAAAADQQEIAVLPFALLKSAQEGSWRQLFTQLPAFRTMCRRGPGRGYESMALVKAVLLLARSVCDKLRRRVRPASPRSPTRSRREWRRAESSDRAGPVGSPAASPEWRP